MSELKINSRNNGGVDILDLEGKIALGETNRELHRVIREMLESGHRNILLNLEKVTMIDSSGLGEMVSAFATAERLGGTLKLCGLSDRFIELMTMTKLYTVFEVYDNEAKALESFSAASEAGAAS